MNKAMLLKQYLSYHKKSSARLPSAYQEVEYIGFNGICYIDTFFKPKNTTKVVMDCVNQSSQWCFGTRQLINGIYANGFGVCGHYGTFANTGETFSSYASSTKTNVVLDSNKVYINGTLHHTFTSFTSASFQSDISLYLFALKQDNSIISGSNLSGNDKCYSCQIYDNGIKVRNFIPCYRKSDNEIGLYDLVNNQFYTNQGTGSFLMGRPLVYDTISGYEQLDYIESTGTQYIDTQVKANSNTTTELIVTLNKSIGGYLYGAFDSWADKIYDTYYNKGKAIAMGFGAEWLPYNSSLDWNKVHSIKIDNKKLYLDNVQVTSSSETFDFGSYNIYIFTLNDKGKPTEESSSVKCHYFKIINEGTLVREFIPMRRKLDNELGLYDLVNKVFYTNQGSGEFIAGEVLKA